MAEPEGNCFNNQQEFEEFLEKSGFQSFLNKSIEKLYELNPKPEDPLVYLVKDFYPTYEEEEKKYIDENEELEKKIKEREAELKQMKEDYEQKLQQYYPKK